MPIRPFGYETDRLTIREDEAAHIRDAAARIIAGEPVTAIEREWNTNDIRTPTGNRFAQGVLRRALRSPRIAGARRNPDGALVDAGFPGIITVPQFEHLLEQLESRKPGPAAPTTTRTYLLTGGLAVCGLCSQPLLARVAVKGRRSYACVSASSPAACGKVRVRGELLDDEVGLRVMGRFQRQASRDRLVRLIGGVESKAVDADDVIMQAQERLRDLGEEYARGRVTSETLGSATTSLKAEISQARALKRTAEQLQSIAVEDVKHFATWWEGASIAQQRTLLDVVVQDVAVMPAPVKGSKVFAPERVKIRWR